MKNKIFTLLFTILSSGLVFGQSTGDIRTTTSGLWFDSIWEMYDAGLGTWSSTSAPSTITSTVTILHDVSILISTVTINSGGQLVIAPTGKLSTNIAITNNVGTSGLLVQASSSGSGQYQNAAAISGTRQTYITGNKWHLVGSPVNGTNTTTAFPGFYMQQYNESDNTWTWNDDPGFNTTMSLGYGYSAWNSTSTTVTASGLFSASNLTISGLPHSGDGFSLLANPYICGLAFTSDWTRSNINNAIYIWDQSAGNYLAYNTGDSYIIKASQGFFMQSSAAGASVTIKAGARTTGSSANPVKSSNTDVPQIARLLIKNTANDASDMIKLEFNTLATTLDYNGEIDAEKMYGSDQSPSLFMLTNDDIPVSIKGLPLEQAATLKLELRPNVDATYTLSASDFTFDANTEILLEDLFTSTITPVNASLSYTFTSLATDSEDRFRIYVTPQANGVDQLPAEDQFNIFGTDYRLKVITDQNNYTIMVYNMLGQKLVQEENIQGNTELDLSAHKQKIVIVSIQTENQVISKKIQLR